jgi:hypothetical protein
LSFQANDDLHGQKKNDFADYEKREDTPLVESISIVYAGWQLVPVWILGRDCSAVLVCFLSEFEP